MSVFPNEGLVCSELASDLTRILQGLGPLRVIRRYGLFGYHPPAREVDEAVEHLLILRQLFQEPPVCLGETVIAPVHDVEFMDAFVPPWEQRQLPEGPGTLAVETGE